MQNLLKQIKSTVTLIAGGAVTHFISKALDHNKNLIEQQAQTLRDQKLEALSEKVKSVDAKCTDLQEFCEKRIDRLNTNTTCNDLSDKLIRDMSNKAKEMEQLGDTLNQLMEKSSLSDPNVQQQHSEGFKKVNTNAIDFQEFVDLVKSGSITPKGGGVDKNFIGNFNFEYLYAYLDSLSLLQESALIHILLFIIILLTLINIFAALFANEILNYFDLENKYPSISGFLKLRAKFQKYYLTWNILFLLILILAAILLNIFIIIVC